MTMLMSASLVSEPIFVTVSTFCPRPARFSFLLPPQNSGMPEQCQKRTEQPQNIGNSGTASVGIFTFLPGTSLDITPKRKAMDTLNASNTNALRYADLKNILTP